MTEIYMPVGFVFWRGLSRWLPIAASLPGPPGPILSKVKMLRAVVRAGGQCSLLSITLHSLIAGPITQGHKLSYPGWCAGTVRVLPASCNQHTDFCGQMDANSGVLGVTSRGVTGTLCPGGKRGWKCWHCQSFRSQFLFTSSIFSAVFSQLSGYRIDPWILFSWLTGYIFFFCCGH